MLFYLKKRNLMHGTTFSNELIARDESLHVRFGCTLHKMLLKQVTDDLLGKSLRALL